MAVAQIQIRRGTTAEWAAADPVVLAAGEQGYDTTLKSSKTGDGATAWSALPWSSGLEAIYPVGSIYMSVVSTNPGTLFGGTWSAWGAGRVPVGIDPGDADFDTAEETGGAKTHTNALTAAYAKAGIVASDYLHFKQKAVVSPGNYDSYVRGVVTYIGATTSPGVGIELGGTTDAGSSVQPYIVAYMWKRTA